MFRPADNNVSSYQFIIVLRQSILFCLFPFAPTCLGDYDLARKSSRCRVNRFHVLSGTSVNGFRQINIGNWSEASFSEMLDKHLDGTFKGTGRYWNAGIGSDGLRMRIRECGRVLGIATLRGFGVEI